MDKNIAMNAAMREFSLDGREPEERLLKIRDLMIKYGYLDEKIPVDKIVDYAYLPK